MVSELGFDLIPERKTIFVWLPLAAWNAMSEDRRHDFAELILGRLPIAVDSGSTAQPRMAGAPAEPDPSISNEANRVSLFCQPLRIEAVMRGDRPCLKITHE